MTRHLKVEITKAVLKQLPYENQSVEQVIRKWWQTMSADGLRLTPWGNKKFQEAEIESYVCPIDVNVNRTTWYSFMNECSKKLKCPYYIDVNKVENKKAEPFIRLYDSKIAMMMTLYGDIHSYLESIKVSR